MTIGLIEGAVDTSQAELEALQDELRDLRRELSEAKAETRSAQRDAQAALSALRKQLSPLYRALQAVFGELDAVGLDDEPTATSGASPARISAVWESWKSRFPGKPAQIIDALLLHGELNTQQLAIAIGSSRNNIPAMVWKLNKAGLINKNGGRFSLKQL